MDIKLMDCTLRDGANIIGKGFSAKVTDMVLDALTSNNVPIIEIGNAGGIGAYEVAGFIDALTDLEYLEIASKYLNSGSEIGMFLNANRFQEKSVELAVKKGLHFIRVGADAGDGDISIKSIEYIKKNNLKVFYSFKKAYLLNPDELAEEGKKLEAAGLDQITIMDSAGTMLPDEVAIYTEKLVNAVSIPVAFHGHNNLGLSAANAMKAYQNGVSMLDCALMGMARSTGNLATEICVTMMQRCGQLKDINLYGLLDFIDNYLEPEMKKHNFNNPIPPLDIILGFSGCHSSFLKKFKTISEEKKVNLYQLIVEVSLINRKDPSEKLIYDIADTLK